MPKLTFSEKHLLRIAMATLRYPEPIARIMGEPSKDEARVIVRRLEAKEKGGHLYTLTAREKQTLAPCLWFAEGFIPQEEAK